MKGKMANFTQLKSYSIKRIFKTILKNQTSIISAITITCTVFCGLDFPVLGV